MARVPSPPSPFALPDDLDAILADCWSRLGRGVADRRAALHTPVVATASAEGPRPRVMVLRAVDRATATLRFHTDARAAKVDEVGNNAPIAVLGYDVGARIQLSASGTGRIETLGSNVDAAWAATALSSRRAYLADPQPGTRTEKATAGLPEALHDRAPTHAESDAGRANFALLLVTLDRIEWLELTYSGNRRAAFVRTGDDWSGHWMIP